MDPEAHDLIPTDFATMIKRLVSEKVLAVEAAQLGDQVEKWVEDSYAEGELANGPKRTGS